MTEKHRNQLAINVARYWKELDAEISTKTSYMSNTKWYKLFSALADNNIDVAEVKFLLDENVRPLYLFHEFDECKWEDFNETGFTDGRNQPFYFREIEWIRLAEDSRQYRDKYGNLIPLKTLAELESIINSVAQFDYEKDESSIKIFGYK